MPAGLVCLHNVESTAKESPCDRLVDIVAVHGLYEDSVEAWTDPITGINWLRDLLPKQARIARVLAYGYDAPASTFFGPNAALDVQRMAEGLVSALCADRRLSEMRQRPIIFVCHGLGGIIVKKSLIYSSTRTAPKVDHLWDPFVSTYALLFFGTPHDRTLKSSWLALRQHLDVESKSEVYDLDNRDAMEELQILQFLTGEFAPLMKQFHMFFFWEELPTSSGSQASFIVDRSSAVLDVDNTEKAGIHATHAQMVKFSTSTSSNYRTVIEAVTRYCQDAPQVISHRWDQAIPALNRLRASEAYELGGLGFDVHLELPFHPQHQQQIKLIHRHFEVPQEATHHFVGREDKFRTLNKAFLPGGRPNKDAKQKTFIVFGLGGSGKTEFCSKFARDNQNHYAAVFTIRAASVETITNSFCKIGEYGGLEYTENAGRHYLSQLKEPWLLIVDNADDPTLNLQSIFPSCDSAHILVTTRNPDFRQMGTLGYLELKGLAEQDAVRLLLMKAEIPKPWDGSTRETGTTIARSLGCLALALIHAGTCIYKRVCKLGDYLSHHSSARHSIQHRRASTTHDGENGDGDDDKDVVKAVYSAFDISLVYLSRKHTIRSQDALELLKIICFYHFERIPVELFERAVLNRRKVIAEGVGDPLTSRLWKAATARIEPPKLLPRFLKHEHGQLDKYRLTWAISELQSLSLIRYDGRDSTFSLHPLVHAWARDSLSASERKVWAAIALNTLLESFLLPPGGSPEQDGQYHGQILPHLEACLSGHERPLTTSITLMGKLQLRLSLIFRPTFGLIIRDQVINTAKCGYVFAARGQFKNAILYLEGVKDTLIRTIGPDQEKTMFSMLALAKVYWGLGRLEEAISLQSSVVDTRSKLFGPQHEDTLQAMDQLGQSYWLHGKYKEALALQQLTTKRMKVTMGQDNLKTLAALDNLGVTLGSWHRYDESLMIHQQVLKARQKALGDEHLDTLTTMNNLAMALLDLGRLPDARALMTKVYEQRQRQLGKEHPWTLWSLCYLAKINVEMGFVTEAEEMLTWGIGAGERSLSRDHIGVLMGRGELARIYARQGKLDIAEKLTLDIIRLVESSRGVAHPDCVYSLWKLTQFYQLKEDRTKAIETCQLALERAEMRIGRSHPLGKKLDILLQDLQATPTKSLDSNQKHVSESDPIRHSGVRHQRTW